LLRHGAPTDDPSHRRIAPEAVASSNVLETERDVPRCEPLDAPAGDLITDRGRRSRAETATSIEGDATGDAMSGRKRRELFA
jgi:hypothetical protein